MFRKKQKELSFEALFEDHEKAVVKIWGLPDMLRSFELQENELQALRVLFEAARKVPISGEDCSAGLHHSKRFAANVYEQLNKNHNYRDFAGLEEQVLEILRPHFLLIRAGVKSPFRIINIRAWETVPEASKFGPNDWHKDGFPQGHLKIMVYLDGLGGRQGKLEVEGFEDLAGPPGLCVLFRNSDVLHRATPPESSEDSRPVVELTLQRLLAEPNETAPMIGAPNDRHLLSPFLAYSKSM